MSWKHILSEDLTKNSEYVSIKKTNQRLEVVKGNKKRNSHAHAVFDKNGNLIFQRDAEKEIASITVKAKNGKKITYLFSVPYGN